MNNFDLHEQAQQLADTRSAYSLARELLELQTSSRHQSVVTETVRTAPERVWLQVGDEAHYHSEPFPADTGNVTWCADSVVGCEVPYVRADLAENSHGIPDGWKLVPLQISESMFDAALNCAEATGGFPEIWSEMLAAAPKPGELCQA